MKKINTFVFIILIFAGSVLSILSFGKSDFSERENRELAEKPRFSASALADGKYFKDINSYVSDHFWERDMLVDLSSNVKSALSDNFIKTKLMSKSDKKTSIIKMDGISNPVIMYDGNVYFVFNSDNVQINKYTKAVNYVYYNLEDVNVSVMLVPTAFEFVDGASEEFGITPQKEMIDKASKTLNNGIAFVDIYDDIMTHRDEYIYFRSDHHWTPLGAYYGYCRYAGYEGFEPVEYRPEPAGEFSGSFAEFTNDPEVAEIKDTMNLQKINVPYWCHGSRAKASEAVQMRDMYPDDFEGYKCILGGDTGYIRIETLNKTDRRLLIIKDSYANALVPYLTEYYNHIVMIDPRYFEDDLYETVENEGITDILFVNNTETISDDAYIKKLEILSGKTKE